MDQVHLRPNTPGRSVPCRPGPNRTTRKGRENGVSRPNNWCHVARDPEWFAHPVEWHSQLPWFQTNGIGHLRPHDVDDDDGCDDSHPFVLFRHGTFQPGTTGLWRIHRKRQWIATFGPQISHGQVVGNGLTLTGFVRSYHDSLAFRDWCVIHIIVDA